MRINPEQRLHLVKHVGHFDWRYVSVDVPIFETIFESDIRDSILSLKRFRVFFIGIVFERETGQIGGIKNDPIYFEEQLSIQCRICIT